MEPQFSLLFNEAERSVLKISLVASNEVVESQPQPVALRSVHSRLGKRPLSDQQQEPAGAPEEGQVKRRIARLPITQESPATFEGKSAGKPCAWRL